MEASNIKAMREALNRADAVLRLISKSAWFIDANFAVTKAVIDACNAIEASLAELPRNCDVGTAEEQLKRFMAFCLSRKCNECPFVSSTYGECGVRWSQMPYVEGGAK